MKLLCANRYSLPSTSTQWPPVWQLVRSVRPLALFSIGTSLTNFQAPPVSAPLSPSALSLPQHLSSQPASSPTSPQKTPRRKHNPSSTVSPAARWPPRPPSFQPELVLALQPSATRSMSSTRKPSLLSPCSVFSGLSLTMVGRCSRSGLRVRTTRLRTF